MTFSPDQLTLSTISNHHLNVKQYHDILTIFKLSDASLQVWNSKYQDKLISFKLNLIDYKRKNSREIDECKHKETNNLDKVEIAILNEDNCKFKNQEQYGHTFNSKELVFLKATIDDINKWVSSLFF